MFKKSIFSLFFILISSVAQAEIYILIDDFSPEKAFPIAIKDFTAGNSGAEKSGAIRDVQESLKRNLKLAGYFDVLNPSRFQDRSQAYLPEDLNYSLWTQIGANGLITGMVKGSGSLTLELRLYDPHLKKLLVGKRYKVKKKNLHVAVHRFMDEILLALTGQRGFYNTKIVAACGPKQAKQIYTMNVDGTEMQAITKNKSLNISPSFSPLTNQIAYTSYQNYFPEIFISNIKGGKPKRITFNKALNITPAFSPDGKVLAISSSMGGDPDLYLFDPQGNQLRQLTQVRGIDIAPTWSPEGDRLIFASERAGNLHLFAINKNGGPATRLTFVGYQNDSPDWSPRGDKVVFSTRLGGAFNIGLMNADGSQVMNLTHGGGSNESPAFSPDGRYIVYSNAARGGNSKLKIMMWDGYNQTIIDDKHNCSNPDWSNWLDAGKE